MILNLILLNIFQNFLFSSFSSLESFRHFPSFSEILLAIFIEFFQHFPFISILYTHICQYITLALVISLLIGTNNLINYNFIR